VHQVSQNDSVLIINLDEIEDGKYGYTSSFFKKAVPIILESHDDALIGEVKRLIVSESYIFILDAKQGKGVFVFDKEGAFVRKIGRIGEGPGEYLNPSDFTINPDSGFVYILDKELQKINTFRISDGDFLSSVKMQNDSVKSFYIQYYEGKLYSDANHVSDTGNDYMLQEIDINTGKQVSRWLETSRYSHGFTNSIAGNVNVGNPFHLLSNSLSFVSFFMDTIISIGNDGLKHYIAVDSKDFMTHNDISLFKKDGIIDAQFIMDIGMGLENKIYSIREFYECSNFLHFVYVQGNSNVSLIYDKNDCSVKKYSVIFDDLVCKIDLGNRKLGLPALMRDSGSEGVYGCIDGDYLLHLQSIIQSDGLNLPEEDVEKLKGLTEDSNPVLFYYEYK